MRRIKRGRGTQVFPEGQACVITCWWLITNSNGTSPFYFGKNIIKGYIVHFYMLICRNAIVVFIYRSAMTPLLGSSNVFVSCFVVTATFPVSDCRNFRILEFSGRNEVEHQVLKGSSSASPYIQKGIPIQFHFFTAAYVLVRLYSTSIYPS